jgi:hypothetical protein
MNGRWTGTPTNRQTAPKRGERACDQALSVESGGRDLNSRPLRPEICPGEQGRTTANETAVQAAEEDGGERWRAIPHAGRPRGGHVGSTPCLQTVRPALVTAPGLGQAVHVESRRTQSDRCVWPIFGPSAWHSVPRFLRFGSATGSPHVRFTPRVARHLAPGGRSATLVPPPSVREGPQRGRQGCSTTRREGERLPPGHSHGRPVGRRRGAPPHCLLSLTLNGLE